MAKLSLQEQMLKAGLVDKKKLKKTAKASKKNRTLKREVKAAADEQRSEQQQRDAELNQQRDQEAQKKAIAAQIVQLIEMNKLDMSRGEIVYNFTDGATIKKLYLTETLRKDVVNGRLAIVKSKEQYQLVAKVVAEKIAQRDDSMIVLINDPSSDVVDEDDPYAAYQIPDDLMW